MEGSDISLESSLLDAMLIFELFEGNFNILPEFALLVLVD
jgi:hypothetical protein